MGEQGPGPAPTDKDGLHQFPTGEELRQVNPADNLGVINPGSAKPSEAAPTAEPGEVPMAETTPPVEPEEPKLPLTSPEGVLQFPHDSDHEAKPSERADLLEKHQPYPIKRWGDGGSGEGQA